MGDLTERVYCNGFNYTRVEPNYDKTQCKREVIDGEEWCIFHHPEKTQEMKKQFYKSFQKEIEHQKQKHPDCYDYSGFHFPESITFETDFHKLYLIESHFHGDLNFRKKNGDNIVFHSESDFTGMTVEGNADFTGVEFKEDLEAFNIKFMKKTCFRHAVFNYVDFSYVTFYGEADYRFARFKDGYSEFLSSEFHQNVYFDNSVFESGGSFWGVWCFEEISFLYVKVEDVLFFDEAWIKKGLIIDEGVKITERAATIEGRSPVPWDI